MCAIHSQMKVLGGGIIALEVGLVIVDLVDKKTIPLFFFLCALTKNTKGGATTNGDCTREHVS